MKQGRKNNPNQEYTNHENYGQNSRKDSDSSEIQ